MKSIIDIRLFAVEQAVAIMGKGTPDKEVVKKAKEIEAYIIEGQDIPKEEPDSALSSIMDMFTGLLSLGAGDSTDIPKAEELKPGDPIPDTLNSLLPKKPKKGDA